MKNSYLILGLILFCGLFLRTYHLASRPLGFTWDEAALGYNAFSLLKTGRDEHGQILPVIFESFGDYKPGAYIYFTTPSVAIFGLSEFATRLPSAIFGSLTIVLIFILVRLMFSSKTALSSSALLAINPWLLHFSRGAWEANLSVFLVVLGVILLVYKQRWSLSALFFGLTFLAYQGSKLFTPLLLLALLWSCRKLITLTKLLLPAVILLVFLIPIVLGLSTQSGRLKVYSVFSYTRRAADVTELLRQDGTAQKNLIYYLFNSEPLDQFRGVVLRYLNHYSPQFIFLAGDWSNARHSEPYQGYFYLPEILTILTGFVYILRHPTKYSNFLIIWILLAPLPSALSRDIVSGVRSLPFAIPLTILSGIGLAQFSHKLVWSIFLLFFFVLYLDLYYLHAPQYTSGDWLYAYSQASEIIKANYQQFSQVVISDKLGQPYIFVLFHLHIPPQQFQNHALIQYNSQGDVSRITSFSNFQFRPIFYPSDRGLTNTLLVGDQYELPQADLDTSPNIATIWRSSLANGTPGLTIVALK